MFYMQKIWKSIFQTATQNYKFNFSSRGWPQPRRWCWRGWWYRRLRFLPVQPQPRDSSTRVDQRRTQEGGRLLPQDLLRHRSSSVPVESFAWTRYGDAYLGSIEGHPGCLERKRCLDQIANRKWQNAGVCRADYSQASGMSPHTFLIHLKMNAIS